MTQPTAAADRLFKVIGPFQKELSAVLQSLEKGKKEPTGVIRIGAPLDFGSNHLIRVISKFRETYPKGSFELTLAIPKRQLDLIVDGSWISRSSITAIFFQAQYPIDAKTVLNERVHPSMLKTLLSKVPSGRS